MQSDEGAATRGQGGCELRKESESEKLSLEHAVMCFCVCMCLHAAHFCIACMHVSVCVCVRA